MLAHIRKQTHISTRTQTHAGMHTRTHTYYLRPYHVEKPVHTITEIMQRRV